jgi:hypothetical protein
MTVNKYELSVASGGGCRDKEKKFFDELFLLVDKCIVGRSIVEFEKNRDGWHHEMLQLYEALAARQYTVENVDQLCISLGGYDATYSASFLKMYDMVWNESLSDCLPHQRSHYKPYAAILEHYNMQYVDLLGIFQAHLTKTLNDTLAIVAAELPNHVIVHLSSDFLMHLAEIELNTFVNLAQYIADKQIANSRSSRIHFDEIYEKIVMLRPRCTHFTIQQHKILEYILHNTKELNEYVRGSGG